MADDRLELSDEVLMAFADGELSTDESERLRPLIEADNDAKKRLEELHNSNDLIKSFFDVDVSKETPSSVAARIRTIAAESEGKISKSNVYSFAAFRSKVGNKIARLPGAKSLQSVSAGNGWQKIAASLIIGGFLGFGVAPEYTETPYVTRGGVESPRQSIGADRAAKQLPRLALMPIGSQPRVIPSGGDIDFSKKYKIIMTNLLGQKISLSFVDKIGDRQPLLAEKIVDKDPFEFPEENFGIKIDTPNHFVVFELVIHANDREKRKMFIFSRK